MTHWASHRVLAVLLLAGCAPPDLHRYAPPGTEADARGFLTLVRAGGLDSAISRLHPALLGPDIRSQTAAVRAALAEQQSPDSAELVGAETNKNLSNGVAVANLTFQLHRGSHWMVANVAFQDSVGIRRVIGLNANPIRQSLQDLNAFTLGGRSPLHYATLIACILAVACCLCSAVYAVSRATTRRWLWAFVALLGIGRFTLSWTDGAWRIQPLAVQMFGAGFVRPGPFGPWILTASFPAGALLAWLVVRRQNLIFP